MAQNSTLPSARTVLFVHVGKTGGTSIAESLKRSGDS
jgi:hypothetical protein